MSGWNSVILILRSLLIVEFCIRTLDCRMYLKHIFPSAVSFHYNVFLNSCLHVADSEIYTADCSDKMPDFYLKLTTGCLKKAQALASLRISK